MIRCFDVVEEERRHRFDSIQKEGKKEGRKEGRTEKGNMEGQKREIIWSNSME
jgi:hypothetical protein